MNAIELAKKYLGKQEDYGQNDGPILRSIRLDMGLPDVPAPWCAAFVGWILARAHCPPNKPSHKSWLREELGFASPFYIDSCRDWLHQATAKSVLTYKPEPGDLFILINQDGIAHHMGFVTAVRGLDGYETIEGNTNEGGSVNGDGVYSRLRPMSTGVRFIRLPEGLR